MWTIRSDDVLGAYGHHYVGVSRPVVPRHPNVRSDLEIVQALAPRVGLGDALAGDPRDWKRRLLAKLEPRGITLERLEDGGPTRHPFAPGPVFAERRFATPTGRANLVTDEPPLPVVPDARYPLILLSLSTDRSQASQWSRPLVGPINVTVHPHAAAGIPDGGTGRLESTLGAIVVRVVHDPRQRTDVALVPKGGRFGAGQCVNTLIPARLSDHGDCAALGDTLVRLVPE